MRVTGVSRTFRKFYEVLGGLYHEVSRSFRGVPGLRGRSMRFQEVSGVRGVSGAFH